MRIKRYWVQNIRTLEEKVLDADNLKEVSRKLNWEKKLIRICKVFYRQKERKSDLVLDY